MGRKSYKPGYNSNKIMKDLIAEMVLLYNSGKATSLRKIAVEFDMSVSKVTKLLVTSGTYKTPLSNEIQILFEQGKTVAEIQNITGLSRSSVHSYLPYIKAVYNAKELSQNAERIIRYRERRDVVAKLQDDVNVDNLWDALIQFENYTFFTFRGLKFKYTVSGGEILFDRKENSKSITKSTVWLAYEEAKKEMDEIGYVSGPKKLKTFGASYLYPIFIRFGLIEGKVKVEK